MASGSKQNKRLITGGLIVLLIGSAVAAQASGGSNSVTPELAAPIIPFVASVAFALNRKRA
ncbi:MAG: hypothetical protein KF836_09435 [Fimbriimonadaceae bacterium]|nr:hypothetical protein [Fimbriimonadaceae bacterium]